MTQEQRDRLIVRSQYLVRHQRLLAADLRQEAMVRALDGRRKCRQSWQIVPFLIGVMRSMIRDDHREEAKGRTLALLDDMEVPAFEDHPFHSEKLAIDTVDYGRTIVSIREALKSDPQLLALQEAILEGKQGAELQRRLGVDERGLDALRRRLKRALLRATKHRSRP